MVLEDVVKYLELNTPVVEILELTKDTELNQPMENGDRTNQIGSNVSNGQPSVKGTCLPCKNL